MTAWSSVLKRLNRQPIRGTPEADAQDLIQAAWLRTFEYCREQEVDNMEAVIERTANGLSVDWHRHAQRHANEPEDGLQPEQRLPRPVSPGRNPREVRVVDQRLEVIRGALNEFREETGDIFLAHRAGFSHGDLAVYFGLSESGTERRIALAMLWLMDQNDSPRQERRIRAEAAVWFARLNRYDRSAETREGLRRWLSEDLARETQFKLATDTWSDPAQCVRKSPRPGIALSVLSTLAAILVLAVGVVLFESMPTTVSTGIGERRTQILEDGTRIELNTDTHIAVHYGAREREIVLRSGEIYLNVIKHEPRPFVVVAGERKVVATGTSFMVHRDDRSVTPLIVTLIEGRVAIEPTGIRELLQTRSAPEVAILNAGERVRFRRNGERTLERPPLDKVTSWREGQLSFVDTPLPEAVQEFNRYSLKRITVRSPKADSIRVNGVFQTEDSLSFIRTVAQDQHMALQVQGDELILESVPSDGSGEKEHTPN